MDESFYHYGAPAEASKIHKMQCRQEPEQAEQENQNRERTAPPAGTRTTESAAMEGLLVVAGVMRKWPGLRWWRLEGGQVGVSKVDAPPMPTSLHAQRSISAWVPLRFTATRGDPDIAKRKRKERQRPKAGFVLSYAFEMFWVAALKLHVVSAMRDTDDGFETRTSKQYGGW